MPSTAVDLSRAAAEPWNDRTTPAIYAHLATLSTGLLDMAKTIEKQAT
jgi:hypothetical protein